jgi:hypothetical protein
VLVGGPPTISMMAPDEGGHGGAGAGLKKLAKSTLGEEAQVEAQEGPDELRMPASP